MVGYIQSMVGSCTDDMLPGVLLRMFGLFPILLLCANLAGMEIILMHVLKAVAPSAVSTCWLECFNMQ